MYGKQKVYRNRESEEKKILIYKLTKLVIELLFLGHNTYTEQRQIYNKEINP